jgi:ABC-2 type transport system ATP-binding protein
MMNEGRILVADTPQNLKASMKGALIEVVCEDIRKASALLKAETVTREVQAFGDRLNVVVDDEKKGMRKIVDVLKKNSIEVTDRRTIRPSLENVFISLLSESTAKQETVEGSWT